MSISLCADGPIEFNGQLIATLAGALRRYRVACTRRQAARYLIELDGLAIKAGIVGLTDDDWTMNYGATHRKATTATQRW